MIDLTKPMADAEIKNLDYFEKAQLYHNVYRNKSFFEIPVALRPLYQVDDGLGLVKMLIQGKSLKNPYEIARGIKALNPSLPQTYQEIYSRAAYLADICDTSVEKILRSDIFNTKNFIPQLNEEAIALVLKTKTTGMDIPLKPTDYTPHEDEDEGGGDTPTPAVTSDYADEEKIYFTLGDDNIVTCNKNFNEITTKLPKLPAAELLYGSGADSQNVLNVSCGYNDLRNIADFNFIRMHDNILEFLTVHYSASAITIETNEINLGGNG